MLHLGAHPGGFDVPDDIVTQASAILAVRRAGKSNAAVVLAEELFRAGHPFVTIDPKGDWWGMRHRGEGAGARAGLAILILGGYHGDIDLDPAGGALVADLITEANMSAIVDVSALPSRAKMLGFLADFFERLYRNHQRQPEPRLVICEEADDYDPQRILKGDGNMARCAGSVNRMVKLGGNAGLGCCLVSQRTSSLHWDALSQVETLIALRTTTPRDRAAIREWLVTKDQAKDVAEALPSLKNGEALVISPHFLGVTGQRVRFRRRSTFDSGATPKVGESREVTTMATVDLAALSERMAEVAAEAEANNPKALRSRIADLERQLADAQAAPAEVRIVEVGVLTDAQLDSLHAVMEDLRQVPQIGHDLATAAGPVLDGLRKLGPRPVEGPESILAGHVDHEALRAKVDPVAVTSDRRTVPERKLLSALAYDDEFGDSELTAPERKLLAVLAAPPHKPLSTARLARLAGYSAKASSVRTALASLRRRGYVTATSPVSLTGTGQAIAPKSEPLPTGPELVDYWMGKLKEPGRRVLAAIVEAHPVELTMEELAEAAGYSVKASSLRTALAQLRSLELIKGRALVDELAA